MRRFSVLVVMVCLAALTTEVLAAESKPKPLTAQQAEVRAREFCKQVGWTPIGKPTFRLDRDYGEYGIWDVEFPEKGRKDNTISISVDRLQGTIRYAVSDSADDKLELSNKVTLSDKQAEQAALKFLKIIGARMEDARLDGVTRESNTHPETDLRLEVNYSRYYKGIKFAGDSAGAAVNPRDGSLIRMWYSFGSPLPEKTTAAVGKDAATKIAAEYLRDKREIDGLTSAELLIARTGLYIEDTKPRKPGPVRSSLAWWITFSWDKGHEAYVVVDAETGKVLHWSSCM